MEHGQVHHPRDGNNFKRNIRYFEERDVKKRKENSIRNNFGIVNVAKRERAARCARNPGYDVSVQRWREPCPRPWAFIACQDYIARSSINYTGRARWTLYPFLYSPRSRINICPNRGEKKLMLYTQNIDAIFPIVNISLQCGYRVKPG